jgi:branched-chain amino acid transport system ATP-binding protein
MGEGILDLKKISRSFGGIQALNHVDLTIRAGELFSIVGPNGAGKTTLLNCISAFIHPNQGAIYYKEQEITFLSPHEITTIGIARTFQHAELFNRMSVLENIKTGRHIHMRSGLVRGLIHYGFARREEIIHRAEIEKEIVDLLDLEAFRKEIVGSLPWGIQKRVDLARALASKPDVLLLDEPTGGMSLEEREDMVRYILTVKEFWNVTIIMIEHDMRTVFDISDRIGVLNFGNMIAVGSQDSIFQDPLVRKSFFGQSDE